MRPPAMRRLKLPPRTIVVPKRTSREWRSLARRSLARRSLAARYQEPRSSPPLICKPARRCRPRCRLRWRKRPRNGMPWPNLCCDCGLNSRTIGRGPPASWCRPGSGPRGSCSASFCRCLDNLDRALDAAEHHEEGKVLAGVRMTRDMFVELAAGQGSRGDRDRGREVRPCRPRSYAPAAFRKRGGHRDRGVGARVQAGRSCPSAGESGGLFRTGRPGRTSDGRIGAEPSGYKHARLL